MDQGPPSSLPRHEMPRSSTSCWFKNSRDAFWKNPQKRTEKQAILFEAMQPTNLQSSQAWTSREDLKAIFQSFEIRQAKERFPS
ncbi:MAG: transposase [Flavobacteriaceae bacterium]|nr:transposase [Flavobacteriaceae bacterium]